MKEPTLEDLIVAGREDCVLTFQELADQFGLSREKVRQIYNKYKFRKEHERTMATTT